jgi:hypothetical protein
MRKTQITTTGKTKIIGPINIFYKGKSGQSTSGIVGGAIIDDDYFFAGYLFKVFLEAK